MGRTAHGPGPNGPFAGHTGTLCPLEKHTLSEQTVTINIAGNNLMAGLLGHRDEYLRVVEGRFPTTSLHESTLAPNSTRFTGRVYIPSGR